MNITKEESEAYSWAIEHVAGTWNYVAVVRDALRRHIAAEMRLAFEATNHCITAEAVRGGVRAYRTNYDESDPRHNFTDADWERAAHEALISGEES